MIGEGSAQFVSSVIVSWCEGNIKVTSGSSGISSLSKSSPSATWNSKCSAVVLDP